MADQTHGAVDSLLGLLSSAITDEARLLGGVQGDMQFIKDEMDSMNGFLLHLTKSSVAHNDQHRAWMKQVREIAYIAQDCIEQYVRDLSLPDGAGAGSVCAAVRHLAVYLRTMPARHRLATRIRDLKVRVRDVGERRLRYGVTVPDNAEIKGTETADDGDEDAKNMSEKRKAFLGALDRVQDQATPESFGDAIDLLLLRFLPGDDPEDLKTRISHILKKYMANKSIHTCKMLLCALHAYPDGRSWQDLQNLDGKLEKYRARVLKEVMVFCYSKLSTHYKSCLQYLTAFKREDKISRVSLVWRWVAEGLVARGEKEDLEEAGEACFNDLIFLQFISPVAGATSDAGWVKSCEMTRQVRDFIFDMAKSENFVLDLPSHLERQVKIRDIVTRQRQQDGNAIQLREPSPWRSSCSAAAVKEPMDDLVDLLRSLPEEYRLNVVELGGCTGVKKRHLKSICKVTSLKYLSLRKTNVTRLPRQICHLWHLETLDVRETNLRPDDTQHILLPRLKHLLAGRKDDGSGDNVWPPTPPFVSTVMMPLYVGAMTKLEILSHVSASRGGAAVLRKVDLLKNLKKLGVVVDGDDQASVESLLRAIGRLGGILSLSVWIDGGTGVSLDMSGEADGKLAAPGQAPLEDLFIRGNVGSHHGLPEWIRGLNKLSEVTLCETSLPGKSLRTLGALQSLCSLCLLCNSFVETNLMFNTGEFVSLESLRVEDDKIDQITFHQEAAQKLKKISWSFTFKKASKLSEIEGLAQLEKLELNAHGDGNQANNMERGLNQIMEERPLNRPDFKFNKFT